MTLWHLVQIDSRSNRQTQKRQTLGQTGRQTGQVHGQHSVVWHQESDGSREVRGAGLSPHLLPGRVQWILADRGEEDTSCPSARLSAHNCAPQHRPVIWRRLSKRGKTLPRFSSERPPREKKRKSSRSQEEEEEEGDDGEENMGVVLKKWISCPRFLKNKTFFFISVSSSLLSLVAPSCGSSCSCHLKDRKIGRERKCSAVRVWPHHRTFSCN